MPINNLLKSAAVIVFGGVIGFSAVKYAKQPTESNRQLASVTYSKLASEQFAKNLFQVALVPDEISATADQTSTVKVSVKALKAFPKGLKFKWNLPESAKLVSGDLVGELDDFAADQQKEFSIQLTHFSKAEKTFVSFEITGQLDGKQIRRDILASSRPEDSFEYVVQKIEQQRQQASDSNSKDNLQKTSNPKKLKSAFDPNKAQF